MFTMANNVKKAPARFYVSKAGNAPVRDWLLALSIDDRKVVGGDIATAEFGWPVGMPICKPMGSGLYEIRSNLTNNRITRMFVSIHLGDLMLLHGFIKKTQQTPKAELDVAIKRKREVDLEK